MNIKRLWRGQAKDQGGFLKCLVLWRGDGEAGKRQIGKGGWQKRSIKKRAAAAPKEQETNEYPETKKSYDMMAKVYV